MDYRAFPFGTLADGTEVTAAQLTNGSGASVTVLDYGATIQSICVPDRNGRLTDVVLGYDTAEEYERNGCYLGATVGRVANRIGGAEFRLNGILYTLAKNDGENHLHGGLKGFDKHIWSMDYEEDSIVCRRLSPDGEEGYPGNLQVRVTFRFTEDNELHIIYDADTDKDTPVNLTNHSYFNLDGSRDILNHKLQIFSDSFLETGEGCLPTGKVLPVEGTAFDFREAKAIGRDIENACEQLSLAGGYDHNFCLEGEAAAVLMSDLSGIRMTVMTDMPGMQVYSGNFMDEHPGKGGRMIGRRSAVALETQMYPNALAIDDFESPVLKAGEHLRSETVYAFSNY